MGTNRYRTTGAYYSFFSSEHISVQRSFCLVDFQSLSCVQLFATPWTAAHEVSLSFNTLQSLLKLMSFASVMPSNHFILSHLLFLPSIFLSIRVFSKESTLCIRWPKYWSFIYSLRPSNKYSGSISFRIDLFDLLDVHGTFKSLIKHPQFESINYLALRLLYGPIVTSRHDEQENHSFFHTGKSITLTIRTFVGKAMPLLFKTLSTFVITFLPKSKCLNFVVAVSVCSDFGAKKIKSSTVFIFSHLVAMNRWSWMPWS